jgi:hypothetical protein
MKYIVYGDYGYVNEQELYSCNSRDQAVVWAKKYCRRDTGGYNVIEVAYFANDGEYVPVWQFEAEEELLYDEL